MGKKNDKGPDILQKIMEEHKELSSLPQVLAEILKVSSDPDSSANDLAAIIMKDPALTVKILRIVNSPYFGKVSAVTTVNQAVVTLGLRTVTAIALSASVYDIINTTNTLIDPKHFWRHSLEVAIAARLIAEKTGFKPSEEAFIAGLLHDIGVLILESSFPEEFRRIWKLVESGENQVTVEQRTWGTDHARVGQFLLEQWGLPKVIGGAIGNHHEMFNKEEKSPYLHLAQIINLANNISRFKIYNMPPPETKMLENKDTIAANLELSQEDLSGIIEILISEVIKESGYLEIEIGSMEELLIEANKLLFGQFMHLENLLRENRTMQQQIGRDQTKKATLESLKTMAATLGHYTSDAINAIRKHTKKLNAGIAKGKIIDKGDTALLSLQSVDNAVEIISTIIGELKKFMTFETSIYNENSYQIELEENIKNSLKNLEKVNISTTMEKEIL